MVSASGSSRQWIRAGFPLALASSKAAGKSALSVTLAPWAPKDRAMAAKSGFFSRVAETRPGTLDAMARISGVGAVKLERYGDAFLRVVSGDGDRVHPARRKLAGQPAGAVFDRLQDAQARLARGADGTGKAMSCTSSTLRWIAERRPASLADLARAPGISPPKLDRFGDAFLEVLEDG